MSTPQAPCPTRQKSGAPLLRKLAAVAGTASLLAISTGSLAPTEAFAASVPLCQGQVPTIYQVPGLPRTPTGTHENVYKVTGTNGNDVILLVGQTNLLDGYTVDALGGDDLICTYHNDRDTIRLGTGNDRLLVQAGAYKYGTVVYGDAGNDEIRTGTGRDWISGGGGADTIYAGGSSDYITGGGGNDLVNGDDEDDSIHGGDGDDFLSGGNGRDDVVGNDGNDRLYGNAGGDHLRGHDGYDYAVGGDGTDSCRFGIEVRSTCEKYLIGN